MSLFVTENEVKPKRSFGNNHPDEGTESANMMEPPLTSKVLRAPNLKRGQENVRIQDRVSDD